MIAYEIQLRYVIRDKIHSETKFSLRKNLRKSLVFFVKQKIVRKKILSWTLSQISHAQSELSRTNRCLSSLSGKYIPQLFKTSFKCIIDGFKWIQANPDEKVPETKYTMKQLKEDQIYEFRIAAENKAGVGPVSDPTAPIQVKEPVSEYFT